MDESVDSPVPISTANAAPLSIESSYDALELQSSTETEVTDVSKTNTTLSFTNIHSDIPPPPSKPLKKLPVGFFAVKNDVQVLEQAKQKLMVHTRFITNLTKTAPEICWISFQL
jgi:hypothetical protein